MVCAESVAVCFFGNVLCLTTIWAKRRLWRFGSRIINGDTCGRHNSLLHTTHAFASRQADVAILTKSPSPGVPDGPMRDACIIPERHQSHTMIQAFIDTTFLIVNALLIIMPIPGSHKH